MRMLILAALIALTACSTGPKKLAEPDGKLFRFNPDKWAAAEAAQQQVGLAR